MTINRVGSTDQIQNLKNTNKVQQSKAAPQDSSINVSKSAAAKAELMNTANIVRNSPDIRTNKIEEIKAKLKDPNYINDTVINSVADKIMEDFGI